MMAKEPHPTMVPDNFARLLFDTAEDRGDRIAVVEADGFTSYRNLAGRAGTFAAELIREGVQSGDRAAVLLPRSAQAAAAFFGVLASGAVAVLVNESLRPRQIEHVLKHSGARVLLTSVGVLTRLPRSLETTAVTLDVSAITGAEEFQPIRRVGHDPAQIIYTSGSTGLPKGVTVSHANLWAGTQAVVMYLGLSGDERIASLLPFSFDYGLNQLACAVATGATLVVERSPVPERIFRTLSQRQISVLPAVPPLWLELLSVQSFHQKRIESLRIMTNTGGRLPTPAVRQLRDCQPQAGLVLMYGLTEAFRSTFLPSHKVDKKPNSIGGPIPGAEILVLRQDLTPCRPGETGELVHRGPTVTMGYWNDPEATARVYRANPLRPKGSPDAERVVFSGDLVYRDEEDDLYFVGRRDRMIKSLGYRLSPDEVAEVLYASGEVAEVIVTSEPDEIRGASIIAHVVLRPEGRVDRLHAFSRREMPRYMQPTRIEVRSSLPHTHTGKYDIEAAAQETHDSP
jgi:amino acid adenylation domain-containing protein